MGHSNIATTTRYLHVSDADLSAAVDRAHWRYDVTVIDDGRKMTSRTSTRASKKEHCGCSTATIGSRGDPCRPREEIG